MGRRRKILFSLALAVLPILLIASLEGILRLAGFGDDLPLFVPMEKRDGFLFTNPEIGKRYFGDSGFLPATSFDAFLAEKPDSVLRIFVLGGSSTAGFPWFNNGAFPRMLRTRLEQHLASGRLEIVNLGMPAVNSYTLLDLAEEVADQQPDAVLVYAGHNEFYGAFGSASTASLGGGRFGRFVKTAYLRVRSYRIAQLMSSVVTLISNPEASSGTPARNTLMARLAAEPAIPLNSEMYRQTLDDFQANMRAFCNVFTSRGVPVFLGELVSNLRHQQPFVSIPADTAMEAEWHGFFDSARAAATAGSLKTAVEMSQKAAELDSGRADLWFLRGQIFAGMQDFDAARRSFILAKDRDALRFRASEDATRILHRLEKSAAVYLVPLQQELAEAAEDGLIGRRLMVDHLHPSLEGHFLMARAFARSLASAMPAFAGAQNLSDPKERELRDRMGITRIDSLLGHIRLSVLLNNWPFRGDRETVTPLDFEPKDLAGRLAMALWQEKKSWDIAHMEYGEALLRDGDAARAAEVFGAVRTGLPWFAAAPLRQGQALLQAGRYADALDVFRASLTVRETPLAHKWVGALLLMQNENARGLSHLHRAAAGTPGDTQVLFNLSIGYAKAGNYKEAKRWAEQMLRVDPNNAQAKAQLEKLKQFE